jgi:glycine cleavage system aminomethyltransferase T
MSAPAETATLKRTPLYALHRELGAKLFNKRKKEVPA